MVGKNTLEIAPADPETQENAPPIPAKPKKRKPVGLVVGIFAAAAALTVGYMVWQHASSVVETDDAFVIGRVHQLGSRIGGTVIKVAVDDNQHVKTGQLLVQIDPRDFQMQVDSAKAAMEKAQMQAVESVTNVVSHTRTADASKLQASSAVASAYANVDMAKAALAEARSSILSAKAQVEQREAELKRATLDFERYKSLIEDRAATMQSFDQAKATKQVAEANLDSSKAGLEQAKLRVVQAQQSLSDAQSTVTRAFGSKETAAASVAQTETMKRDIAVQNAAAKQARAEYENALLQLSYTNITAPISGRVGHRTVEVGQQIERGQALMSVVSDEKWVVANFKETQLQNMRVGQPVDIKIDAIPEKVFHGHVDSLSPASGAQFTLLPPDNASGNFTKVVQRVPTKIVFEPDSIKGYEDRLTPGMSVVPEVHIRSEH